MGNSGYTMQLADNIGTEHNYIPKTLATLLEKNGRLDGAIVIDIANGILDGVATIHESGLIHRDIKPANIIFCDDLPMLSDIGLVTSFSLTVSLAGTMGFIPPEKLSDSTFSSSNKTNADDLYAIGKVLYCAFTGNSPECYPSVTKKILADAESRKINKLVKIACHATPYFRFTNARDFKAAFNKSISFSHESKVFLISNIQVITEPIVLMAKGFLWIWKLSLIRNLLIILLAIWIIKSIAIVSLDYDNKITFNNVRLVMLSTIPHIPKFDFSGRRNIEKKLWGQIDNRTQGSIIVGEGKDGVIVTQPPFDHILSKVSPYILEDSPRQNKIVLENDFSPNDDWKFYGNGIRYENCNLVIAPGIKGSVKLLDYALPDEYEISFKTNVHNFKGILEFWIIADVYLPNKNETKNPSRLNSKYYFKINGNGENLEFMPVMYREQDYSEDNLIEVCASGIGLKPKDMFYEFKIIMTSNVLRVFCDGNLVYYGPSIFKGGIFSISFKNHGNTPITFKNFKIHDIRSVRKKSIKPEDEFKLPSPVKDIGFSPIKTNTAGGNQSSSL